MLSLPDFKEKQIVFIQTERGADNKILFWNENIRYLKDNEIINQTSCYKILAIFIIGDVSITTALIKKCREYGISIFLLNHNFDLYSSILSQAEGNYLLRMKQYFIKDELSLSKNIVKNKLLNQFILLDRTIDFGAVSASIDKAEDNQVLLGIEGNCAKNYYSAYFKNINWCRRAPRTKEDIPNFLLDIGYTFLFNFIDALLLLFGFDTYKGFYHKLFFQRKSLTCDLMEPFRCLIDKQLLKSYHLNQINHQDFIYSDGKYQLKFTCLRRQDSDKLIRKKYVSIFFDAILNRKEEIFTYIKGFYYYIAKSNPEMNSGQEGKFPVFRIK